MARRQENACPLLTPRTTQNDYAATCNKCLRSVAVDLGQLIATGRGDVPLIRLKLRCSVCGSRDVSGVVSGARHAGY